MKAKIVKLIKVKDGGNELYYDKKGKLICDKKKNSLMDSIVFEYVLNSFPREEDQYLYDFLYLLVEYDRMYDKERFNEALARVKERNPEHEIVKFIESSEEYKSFIEELTAEEGHEMI